MSQERSRDRQSVYEDQLHWPYSVVDLLWFEDAPVLLNGANDGAGGRTDLHFLETTGKTTGLTQSSCMKTIGEGY